MFPAVDARILGAVIIPQFMPSFLKYREDNLAIWVYK